MRPAFPVILSVLATLPLLAACHAKVDSKSKDGTTFEKTVDIDSDGGHAMVSVGGEHGLKIDTDGFKAALDIPGMEFGGKDFDIDGMKLYPGSKVKGMKVKAHDTEGDKSGTVTVTFVSPASPDAVLVHAEAQAKDEDYTVTRSGLTLTGKKDGDKSFVYSVVADGARSVGTLTMTDTDGD